MWREEGWESEREEDEVDKEGGEGKEINAREGGWNSEDT